MIVLGEYRSWPTIYFVQNLVCEILINGFIGFPGFGVEDRFGVGIVAQRPQPFIGEPVVVTLFLLLGQPDQS